MSATVQAPGPVLVGVDGSTRNASAVAWAAAEAASSSAPLVLVHDDGGAGEAAGRATLERAAAEVAKVDRVSIVSSASVGSSDSMHHAQNERRSPMAAP